MRPISFASRERTGMSVADPSIARWVPGRLQDETQRFTPLGTVFAPLHRR